jgi:hypothetical protein
VCHLRSCTGAAHWGDCRRPGTATLTRCESRCGAGCRAARRRQSRCGGSLRPARSLVPHCPLRSGTPSPLGRARSGVGACGAAVAERATRAAGGHRARAPACERHSRRWHALERGGSGGRRVSACAFRNVSNLLSYLLLSLLGLPRASYLFLGLGLGRKGQQRRRRRAQCGRSGCAGRGHLRAVQLERRRRCREAAVGCSGGAVVCARRWSVIRCACVRSTRDAAAAVRGCDCGCRTPYGRGASIYGGGGH